MLGPGIGGQPGGTVQPGHRGGVNDDAAALGLHLAQRMLQAQPDTLDIDRHDAVRHRDIAFIDLPSSSPVELL